MLLYAAVAPSSARPSDSATARLRPVNCKRAIFATFRADSPGFAVLVQQEGKRVFEKGYGVRDLRSKTTIDAHTNFRLASFTKQFTAMAIMLLVHDGKLRYDETLTEIFPEFPAYGKNHHGSQSAESHFRIAGLRRLDGRSGKEQGPNLVARKIRFRTPKFCSCWKKNRKANSRRERNGSTAIPATWCLGLIVAKVSGKSFGEFLHERIFAPLKMDHTLVFEKGKNEVANRAYGHSTTKTSTLSRPIRVRLRRRRAMAEFIPTWKI